MATTTSWCWSKSRRSRGTGCRSAYLALRGVPASVDLIVWDRETFESRLHLPASFAATVAREGVLLYPEPSD